MRFPFSNRNSKRNLNSMKLMIESGILMNRQFVFGLCVKSVNIEGRRQIGRKV